MSRRPAIHLLVLLALLAGAFSSVAVAGAAATRAPSHAAKHHPKQRHHKKKKKKKKPAPKPTLVTAAPGTIFSAAPLASNLWVPGAAKAFKVTYATTDVFGKPALSSGEIFIPPGTAPKGGWPVISWAHGTSGLADACAPSNVGPAEPQRDFPYLSNWIKQGYAIVATDYAGLGTAGLPAYLNGSSEAHNVVDMVKAGLAYAGKSLPASEQLSNRWVTIGQSQGAGAAIYTARYATQFGGPSLDYLGAVGTGTPANIEDLISVLGPDAPPAPLTGDLDAYLTYIFASLEYSEPQLGIQSTLTPTGQKYLGLAQDQCIFQFAATLKDVSIGSYFTKPVASLPNWTATVDAYMAMPTSGFDKPFFMGHGTLDTDVPYAGTVPYVLELEANHQPVTFETYAKDHSGTLVAAQQDEIPYVAALFAGHPLPPKVNINTAAVTNPITTALSGL